mmetsp:Transcript_19611/g.38512  ORF Transcript_19611/g.38512 Transcript_19611/m.38512 type:complete len:85 (-) Transcript_19611:249-503(-)
MQSFVLAAPRAFFHRTCRCRFAKADRYVPAVEEDIGEMLKDFSGEATVTVNSQKGMTKFSEQLEMPTFSATMPSVMTARIIVSL